jgi:hypothetical protein
LELLLLFYFVNLDFRYDKIHSAVKKAKIHFGGGGGGGAGEQAPIKKDRSGEMRFKQVSAIDDKIAYMK